MRCILLNHARDRKRIKRGCGRMLLDQDAANSAARTLTASPAAVKGR
jgi:hypothetical protein